MLIKISSTGPYLADILHKNPHTDLGLYATPLKEGVVIGNLVDAKHYEVIFWDDKNSYATDRTDPLDFQSLCNPLIVLGISTELFGHLLKEREQYDCQPVPWLKKTRGDIDTAPCLIEVPVFYIQSNWYREGSFLLEKYFPSVRLRSKVGSNAYLSIQGKDVFEAVNLLNLVALFTHLSNEDHYENFIDQSLIVKYARFLTNLQGVPYFVFYLFIKRAVKNKTHFELVSKGFETYLAGQGLNVRFTNEDTQQSRIQFITATIGTDLPVLDIGCGALAYYKRFMTMGLENTYYAVDQEQRFEQLGRSIMGRLGSDNLIFSNRLEDIHPPGKVNIIISEVIEHNSVAEAKALVAAALAYDFDTLIISTPNAEFNQYYYGGASSGTADGESSFRHADHQFEWTTDEFKQFLEPIIAAAPVPIEVSYCQVGDQINDSQPTQLAILKKL